MQALAYKAYGQVQSRTASVKEIEYALFKQITEALEFVAQTENPEPAVWADAICRNMQLWTLLSTDLLGEGNAMPADMKKSLLNLSGFVRTHSLKILSGEGEIADLIEVNTTIMQGLSGASVDALEEGVA